MLFTRRKLERDREAGLIFDWRNRHASSLGMVAAVGLMALVTAVVGSVVRVEVVAPAEVAERHAAVVVVPEGMDDGGLAALAEERSPLPGRFDPERELALPGTLELAGRLRPEYAPELRPLDDDGTLDELPVAQAGAVVLPQRRAPAVAREPATSVAVRARLAARGALGARVPGELPGWAAPVPPEWLGRPLGFVIGVDAGGVVRHCMPLDESVEGLDVQAEGWLRQLRFAPASPAAAGAATAGQGGSGQGLPAGGLPAGQAAGGLSWGAVELRLEQQR